MLTQMSVAMNDWWVYVGFEFVGSRDGISNEAGLFYILARVAVTVNNLHTVLLFYCY
jgi:hypothetical protein